MDLEVPESEPEDAEHGEEPKPEEVEVPDIYSFRPGDSVMSIRRRMREARKAQLEEDQRSRTPSPMSRNRQPRMTSTASLPRGKMGKAVSDAPEERRADQPGRPRIKVARFHKDLIRKQVWRQKFDYLFEKMQAGVEAELVQDRKARRSSVQRSSEEAAAAEAKRASLLTGLEETVPQDLASLRRRSSAGAGLQTLELARLASHALRRMETGPTDTEVGTEDEEEEEDEEPLALYDDCVEPTPEPLPAPPAPAWRRTGPRRKPTVARSLPQSLPKAPGQAAGPPRKTRGIAGLLRPSASLPSLLPELTGVRDDYYEGDDLFMHEDILHASNPQLFPLRGGHSKAFPMRKLVPFHL